MVVKLKKKARNSKGELCSWGVKSHRTNKILGRFTSKEKAEKWLKQIELFKHMKKNGVKLREGIDNLTISNQHYELFYRQQNKNQNKKTIKFSPEVDKEKQILKIKNNPDLTKEEKEKQIDIIKAKYNIIK